MIYAVPAANEPPDQGDLIDAPPLLEIASFDLADLNRPSINVYQRRVIVLTQTCDFANEKATTATVEEVFHAQFLVDQGFFKPADIRGSLRSGRIWGWYFLPADRAANLEEMIVDLWRLHTIRLDLLRELCIAGERLARLLVPYREHLAKHFADTYSRIGLPRPYETL